VRWIVGEIHKKVIKKGAKKVKISLRLPSSRPTRHIITWSHSFFLIALDTAFQFHYTFNLAPKALSKVRRGVANNKPVSPKRAQKAEEEGQSAGASLYL
jgi:hypothetical protein